MTAPAWLVLIIVVGAFVLSFVLAFTSPARHDNDDGTTVRDWLDGKS